jgi:hypothetical protein
LGTYANLTAEVKEQKNAKQRQDYRHKRAEKLACEDSEKKAHEEDEKLAPEMTPDQHCKGVGNLTMAAEKTQEVTPQSTLINPTTKLGSTIFQTCFFDFVVNWLWSNQVPCFLAWFFSYLVQQVVVIVCLRLSHFFESLYGVQGFSSYTGYLADHIIDLSTPASGIFSESVQYI